MNRSYDVVVVGAGPAGMAVAIESVRHGLSTLVLDKQPEPGGQIYRGIGSSRLIKKLGKDYAEGLPLVQEFERCGAQFEPLANVWDIAPNNVYYSQNGKSHCVACRQVVLASGAMERPVPLPDWTAPGVMGVCASDILLKSAAVSPAAPILLCGNGPLILQAAVHMLMFKIPVAGILLTGKTSNYLRSIRHMHRALSRPGYFMHGAWLAANTLFRHRCFLGVSNVQIKEKGEALQVSFKGRSGKQRSLSAATVLLHEGVISENRITNLAQCRHSWNKKQRYWHVEADLWGKTSVQGIRSAGDVASVRGAKTAQAEGRLVGLDIARELGRLSLDQRDAAAAPHLKAVKKCSNFQPLLDELFAPALAMLQPDMDAIVCRCEELTARELLKSIMDGCYSPNALKAQARPGMGNCEGRMCGPALAEMIANAHGIPIENLPLLKAQIPLFPLKIDELVAMPSPSGEL